MPKKPKTPSFSHPIQPVYVDPFGVHRFKKNAIVRYLLDKGPFDLNHLALQDFSKEDHEQFAQLIGYSRSGFADLSYVSGRTWNRAARKKPIILPNSKVD